MEKYFELVKRYMLFFGLLVAAAIYFMWRYFNEKGKNDQAPPLPDLPDGGSGISTGFDAKANAIVTELFDVIDGIWDWDYNKEKSFVVLYNLTDDELVYCYRLYNNKYYNKTKETMTKAIANEWLVTTQTVRPALLNRLRTLKCD